MYCLKNFDYNGEPVPVLIGKDGAPLFDATHVCNILGYANSRDTLQKLDDDEKILLSRDHFDFDRSESLQSNRGGAQFKNYLTEPGLYHLILRSDKPEAKPFRRWVTHEVLPAIRRTGEYAAPGHQGTDKAKPVTVAKLGKVTNAFARAKKLANIAGFHGQAAIIEADRITRELTGTSPLSLLRDMPRSGVIGEQPILPESEIEAARQAYEIIVQIYLDNRDRFHHRSKVGELYNAGKAAIGILDQRRGGIFFRPQALYDELRDRGISTIALSVLRRCRLLVCTEEGKHTTKVMAAGVRYRSIAVPIPEFLEE